MTVNRFFGPYAPAYWLLMVCNVAVPQLLWFERIRRNTILIFIISIIINVGMWDERFVIIITSLHRDWLPSSWGMYYPTFWDLSVFFGTLGLFCMLFFVFCRLLPVIAIAETRELVHETHNGTREPQHMEPAHAK
jgi:molybdopterin-containing oxidoreductase family membrane subunit